MDTWVLRFYPPVAANKLACPWVGPFKVVREASMWVVGIQKDPNAKTIYVHVDDLKRCSTPDPEPQWPEAEAEPSLAPLASSAPLVPSRPTNSTALREAAEPIPTLDGVAEGSGPSSDVHRTVAEPPEPVIRIDAAHRLSRFFKRTYDVKGFRLTCAETCYQARKVITLGASDHLARICKARTVLRARKIGRTIYEMASPAEQARWRDQRTAVRRDIARITTEIDPKYKEDLLLTGHMELQEESDHLFWGGAENTFGEVLMDLREHLMADTLPALPTWYTPTADRPRRDRT